ncbi:SCO2522 family protein [Longispora sp. K20-0274]|uniref:SCO2522 family protein n=1 Tax=Longispora sp. K20-0274 TaxID=3088255 RepID=UPI00399AE420
MFREASADTSVAEVPLSHLSLELGHLYMEDFQGGEGQLRRHFARVAPWAAAARTIHAEQHEAAVAETPGRSRSRNASRPRVSTCFLIDDYFGEFGSPREVLPGLIRAAESAGVAIDYLARESACASAGASSPAALLLGRLVPDPPPGTNGSRPPAAVNGWLCNGRRSPVESAEAMGARQRWEPPAQNGVKRHSIFVDVQLWDEDPAHRRTWSCPFLAAVWQLLRLGLLRDGRVPVLAAEAWSGTFPGTWAELPALLRLTSTRAPFAAYRTMSILPGRFLPVEQAVRTILEQVATAPEVAAQVLARAVAEGVELPAEIVDRAEYVFVGPSDVRL